MDRLVHRVQPVHINLQIQMLHRVRHVQQRRGGQQRPAVQVRPRIPHVIKRERLQIAQVVQLNVPPAA